MARLVRRLPHGQRTPVIMVTAAQVEREARRAGVNSYRRKPREVGAMVKTVARLLARRQKRTRKGMSGTGRPTIPGHARR